MNGVSTSTSKARDLEPAWLRALDRWGGLLVRPRTTAARLHPAEGERDTWALGLLYLLGSEVYGLVEAVAGFAAMKDSSSLMMLGGQLAWALVPPLLTLVVAETLLGPARAYRRAVALLPLVVIGAVAHALRQQGVTLPAPSWAVEVIGGSAGVALAGWIRGAVPPRKEDVS